MSMITLQFCNNLHSTFYILQPTWNHLNQSSTIKTLHFTISHTPRNFPILSRTRMSGFSQGPFSNLNALLSDFKNPTSVSLQTLLPPLKFFLVVDLPNVHSSLNPKLWNVKRKLCTRIIWLCPGGSKVAVQYNTVHYSGHKVRIQS